MTKNNIYEVEATTIGNRGYTVSEKSPSQTFNYRDEFYGSAVWMDGTVRGYVLSAVFTNHDGDITTSIFFKKDEVGTTKVIRFAEHYIEVTFRSIDDDQNIGNAIQMGGYGIWFKVD